MLFQGAYAGLKVFVTGHTGFKGSWLTQWLLELGAEVTGFSLDIPSHPSHFEYLGLREKIRHMEGDIRQGEHLASALEKSQPDIVFHLAAQAIVSDSYRDPIKSFATNAMGTANILEAARHCPSLRALILITSDKCYENVEWPFGYRENDRLGGKDPYSASKACAENIIHSYWHSFFSAADSKLKLASVRAGNVIGGGDWSLDRLIPDLVRGFQSGQPVPIRRPLAIRPWQHVLEPLHGYITLAEKLLAKDAAKYATAYNFGPSEDDARTVKWIVERMTKTWGDGASWFIDGEPSVHEAGYLKLDASKARADLGWAPRLALANALEWLVEWYKAQAAGADMQTFSLGQIKAYEALVAAAE